MNLKLIPLWIVFVVYLFCSMAMQISLSMLLSIWSLGLSVYLLIKNKLPSKKSIIISIVFGLFSSIALLGVEMSSNMVITGALFAAIPTFIASLAVFSVMEKKGGFELLRKEKKSSPFVSVAIAVGCAVVLGAVNCYMMRNDPVDFGVSLSKLMVSLNPAIFEEMVHRAVFMAFCVYVMGENKPTKFLSITMWFMMTVPHVIAHGYDFETTLELLVLFGIPLAILQRKRDITSAMVCHALIDAVRFTIFGV